MAIGPLTNLALATSLDPKFPERLKSLTIMGGNMYSLGIDSKKFFLFTIRTIFYESMIGNTGVTVSEFNFWADPEGSFVTLERISQKTEVCSRENISIVSL